MEKKQLDEIDESYFGEEFLDDEPQVKVETLKSTKKRQAKSKTNSSVKEKPKLDSKVEIKNQVKEQVKETKLAEKVKEVKVEEVKVKELKKEEVKPVFKPEVKPVSKPVKETIETKPSFDPWEDEKEEEEESFFKEASTWKAITGIVVILLVFSIFTQGFSFSQTADVNQDSAASITISEAEGLVLGFVNENLLQEPFTAQVVSSQDDGNLYVVKLSIAGQVVDSYITKDGELFFPQGFDTANPAESTQGTNTQLEEPVMEEPATQEPVVEQPVEQQPVLEEPGEVVLEPVEEPVVEQPVGELRELQIVAKKWNFNPTNFVVNAGDNVKLSIIAQDLTFTFAIVDLGVEQEVSGQSLVEFTPSEPGTYEYSCSSCSGVQASVMKGTLTVE
jgi:heme/copper-type cytochrome/quinol oxidase subunit 2